MCRIPPGGDEPYWAQYEDGMVTIGGYTPFYDRSCVRVPYAEFKRLFKELRAAGKARRKPTIADLAAVEYGG